MNIPNKDLYLNSSFINFYFTNKIEIINKENSIAIVPINFLEIFETLKNRPSKIIVYCSKHQIKYLTNLYYDDFIVYPFTYDEILIRINKIITSINIKTKNGLFSLYNTRITFNKKEAKLTGIEFILLKELICSKERIILRESINHQYGWTGRVLDAHICNIRNKIKNISSDDKREILKIVSIKNIGYSLDTNC